MASPRTVTIEPYPVKIDSNPTEYLLISISRFCPTTDVDKRCLKNELTAIIDRGANINACNEDYITPLAKAILLRNETAVECFLEKGADPNIEMWESVADNALKEDPNKKICVTPLGWAVKHGTETIIELLLKAGADQNQQPTRGHSAKAIAKAWGDKSIISLLEKYEPKPDPDSATKLAECVTKLTETITKFTESIAKLTEAITKSTESAAKTTKPTESSEAMLSLPANQRNRY